MMFKQIKSKFWPPTYRRSGAHRWEKLLQPDLSRVCAGAERRNQSFFCPCGRVFVLMSFRCERAIPRGRRV